jgi:transcriptional regulator with XRE-family HTH domain
MRTLEEIKHQSVANALRRARELKELSRVQLGEILGITPKTVERYENARGHMSEERKLKIIEGIGYSIQQFEKIRKGKSPNSIKDREKIVLTNSDRRSYKRVITKECEVLKSLRRIRKIPQAHASSLCGYPRSYIGHVENGRIELDKKRIKRIVEVYGYTYSEFEGFMGIGEMRDTIIDNCIKKIEGLDDVKLDIVKNLLASL